MLDRVLTVARREFRSYFDHATAYILLVVFLVVNFFFFFRDAYLVAEASLRPMFGLLPWLLLFFVPAVTMRSLAEERRTGTLEHMLAQPVGEAEFLLGKFLGVMGFLAVALLGTAGAAVGLSLGGDLQWGVAVAQYAGALLLAAGLTAVGLWASSLTENQVTAFIIGVAVTFLLYSLSLDVVVLGLPPAAALVAERLGVLGHFVNIGRGVIDLRDVLYFVSLAAAFLSLTYFSVLREKLSRRRSAYRRLRWGTAGLVGIAVLASLLGAELRGRLDLTPGKAYTLSPVTRAMLSDLPDVVTVKFVASRELPPEFGTVKRDVEDLLRDYDALGGANLRIVRLLPQSDEGDRREAETLNIPTIQFNVYGEDEFQVRQGYLGLALQYAGETERIPVIRQTENLEYRLTTLIRSLTAESRPRLGFLVGHGEHDLFSLRAVNARLQREYEVERVRLDTLETGVPEEVDVVVVPGPSQPFPQRDVEALRRFLERGGNLLVLASGVEVDPRSRTATPLAHVGLDSLLAPYGARVLPGMAFDLRTNARVPVPSEGGGISYVLAYPLWPLLQPASSHITVRELGPVFTPWASALELTQADTATTVRLLTTTDRAGRLERVTSLDVTQDFGHLQAEELGPQTVAAALLPPAGAEARGRVVLVGNDRFILDDFLQGNPNNLHFFQNAVDWLAQEEALIGIRSKDRTPPTLLFPSAFVRDAVKYGNLVGVPVLFVLIGVLRLARRRRLARRGLEAA